MHHRRVTGATFLVVALAFTACTVKEQPKGADTGAAAASASVTQSAANTVHIIAKDYSFDAPAQVSAGLTTFHLMNQGKELHQAGLIKLNDGKTVEDFMAAMKTMQPNTPPPAWISFAGGPNAAAPGGTAEATQTLEPGNYVLICFIPSADGVPHVMKGMARGLVVAASSAAAAAEPTPTSTMTMSDYKFDLSQPMKTGQNVIRVDNAGPQPHEVVLFKLAPGKTMKDFESWLPVSDKNPPPAIPMGGVVTLSAGQHSYFDANLDAGDYVLVCFVGDVKDHKPHFAHGMVQSFKIQ